MSETAIHSAAPYLCAKNATAAMEFYKRAFGAAGANAARPLADQFYGHRGGQLLDPFGHKWNVSAVKEQLTGEEVEKRYRQMTGGQA